MKSCFKCGLRLPLTEFYKHSQMADGHLNKCKGCTKIDTKKRLSEKIKDPNWAKKERARHREKYHRLGYSERHRPSSDKKKEIMSKYNTKYPEKKVAKNLSSHIEAPDGMEKHHWSYKRQHAKDLFFLTNGHHNSLHRRLIYCKTGKCYKTKDNILLDTREKHEAFIKVLGF